MRHLLTAILLAIALVLYYLGLETSSIILFALGAATELAFWARLIRFSRP